MGQPIHLEDIGLEFDRLREIQEIKLNNDLLKFLEETRTSLESPRILEVRDIFKRSLLHYAAMGECTSLLLYLLQKEPNTESRDMHGRTPLSWAAEYGSLAVVKILLDRGANINAVDYEDTTPLAHLVHAGNLNSGNLAATEAILRERGAKLGRNPLERAWVWILRHMVHCYPMSARN